MFNQIFGTTIVQALLEQLKGDDMVAQPASLDSFWVREQNLLPIGGPFQIQAINGIDWYVTDGGGSEDSKICVLRQDDPYGEAGLEGVQFELDALGMDLVSEATFPSGNPDFTAQITQLKGDGCDAVWLTSTPLDTGSALGKAAELGFNPQWLGQAPTWIGALTDSPVLPYLQDHFVWVSEGPEHGDESAPGMAELERIQETYAPDQGPDVYFDFGYNEAKAVDQVLEAAVENGDLSHQGIIDAMNSIDEFKYDGLLGDYPWGAPEDRNPPRTSSIFKVDPSKPIGLSLVEADHEAPNAKDFEF
jgi:ABC-type branched-subunit amino acid transport system substrate-binding protein